MLPQVKYVKEFADSDQIHVECAPSITERILTSFKCQECVIENYSKLKEKTYYTMTCDKDVPERTLKLYKTNRVATTDNRNETERTGIHRFQFHCDLTNPDFGKMSGSHLTNKMEFYIMYDQDEAIRPGDLVETNYGYSIEVRNEIISNHLNKYLQVNDKLVLQFRYSHYYYSRGPLCRSGLPRKKDEQILSKDLLALYESGKFTDFALMDEDGREHLVHRSVCRSRSTIIGNIDDDNVVAFTVRGKSHHVEIAVRYMYSGILPQLSVGDLLHVLEIAEELNIKRLLLSIKLALLEILNKSNADRIYKIASRYSNMTQIVALAEEFIFPNIEKKKKVRL